MQAIAAPAAAQSYSAWAYLAVFALMALSFAGLPAVGATVVGWAAAMASQGKLNIAAVLIVAVIGAEAGGLAGYGIGDRWGRKLLRRPGRWQQRRHKAVAKAEAVYAKWGRLAVFFTSTLISGMLRMKYSQFVVWNFIVGAVYVLSVGPAAYGTGKVLAGQRDGGGPALLVAGLALAAGCAVLAVRYYRRRASPRRGEVPQRPAGDHHGMDGSVPGTRTQRWLARLSLALAISAVVIVMVFAGLKSVAMLAVGATAAAVSLAAGFLVLSRRGVWRWLSFAVFALAPIAVVAVFALAGLLWVALASVAAWLLAGGAARLALAATQPDWQMPEYPALPSPAHPYLIMNPRSGGGKVGRFDLKRKAEELGAEVFLMDGPEPVDVAAVARRAVARGADLLGVAGGDGTQALVAGVAAQHRIPFMVITAGTRNHFALDLGLDRDDPVACLGALSDAVELRVDLGAIGGQTFVNNASFGAYAEVVDSPAYRGDKLATTLDLLPGLLHGHRGARLTAQADGVRITAPQALLVGNNPYGTGDIAGLGRRARLDRGMLGVIGVRIGNARQAAALLRGAHAAGLSVLTTGRIEITADAPRIPVGIDGEAAVLPTPVRCAIRPGALRVWVPRDRPGVPRPKPSLTWARLLDLARPAIAWPAIARHG